MKCGWRCRQSGEAASEIPACTVFVGSSALGRMAVSATRDWVEVLVEPGPYQTRRDHHRRRQLLSEHARRRGDPAPGGVSRQPVMTAYRQQACRFNLDINIVLTDIGPGSSKPRTLLLTGGNLGLRSFADGNSSVRLGFPLHRRMCL
jgi:putative PD-(D/E)XK phosphodiesterase DUF2161